MAISKLGGAFNVLGKKVSNVFPKPYGTQKQTPFDANAAFKKSSGLANQAFDSAQTGLAARTDVARENAMRDWQKSQVSGNAPTGGAADLLKQKMMSASESGFAGQASDIEAQRAQTLTGLSEGQADRAQKQAMFTDQMNFSWAELDETKRNDIINGIALLHSIDARKWSPEEGDKYRELLREYYGSSRVGRNKYIIQGKPGQTLADYDLNNRNA